MRYRYRQNPVEDYLARLGISQEIVDFVKFLSDSKIQGKIVNELRKNRGLNLGQIQDLAASFEPKEIKLDYYEEAFLRVLKLNDVNIAKEMIDWVAIQIIKHRTKKYMIKGEIVYDQEFPILNYHDEETIDYVDRSDLRGTIWTLIDWYNAEHPRLASYDFIQAQLASIRWHKAQAEKGKNLVYEPIYTPNILYTWPDNWTIQEITTENDITVEGNRMNHCIASYWDQVLEYNMNVISLRDQENKPHVTAAFVPRYHNATDYTDKFWELVDIEGHSNSNPKPEYKKRIGQWMQSIDFGKKVFIDQIVDKIDNKKFENSGSYIRPRPLEIHGQTLFDFFKEYNINYNTITVRQYTEILSRSNAGSSFSTDLIRDILDNFLKHWHIKVILNPEGD